MVQKLAQKESELRRKFHADKRKADYWYERSLEKVSASNTAVKHHKAQAVIGKLSTAAENALERAQAAKTCALISQVHMLEISVLKHEARVEHREVKLRSLRRRLRRRRLMSLCRW